MLLRVILVHIEGGRNGIAAVTSFLMDRCGLDLARQILL